MSLTIQQIITDAKQLAGKLKERESIADMLVNDSQAAIKRAAELRQVCSVNLVTCLLHYIVFCSTKMK